MTIDWYNTDMLHADSVDIQDKLHVRVLAVYKTLCILNINVFL